MRKVLLITSRNVLTACGELRLIKNRAEALYKQYEVATDIIAFSTPSRADSCKKETIDAGGKIRVIAVKSSGLIPLVIGKAADLALEMNQNGEKYEAIILSGVGVPNLAKKLKKHLAAKIIFDVHGASEDILELSKTGDLSDRLKYFLIFHCDKNIYKRTLRYADGCFVVTHALQEYLSERYKTNDAIRFYKVPCATSTDAMPEDVYKENRKKYREKYRIDDDTKVFIYSGGVSVWQCIEETIALYNKIRKACHGKTKLLMFSHNIEQLKKIAGEDEDIVFDSYCPDELEAALCAGDFAFMLRKDSVTNNVAFPNKYLEYVRSNLRIIATPHVHEIAAQINQYDLGYIYDFEESVDKLAAWVERPGASQNIQEVLKLNSFAVRLQDFVRMLDSWHLQSQEK